MSVKARRAEFLDFMEGSFFKKEKTPSYLLKGSSNVSYLFFSNKNKIKPKTIFVDLVAFCVVISSSDRKENSQIEVQLCIDDFCSEFNVCNPLQFENSLKIAHSDF